MTGQLFVRGAGESVPEASHIHVRWRMEDGSRLIFRDPRRFGGVRVFRDVQALEEHWEALGPDALTITPGALAEALGDSDRAVKAALLDQAAIAGVGNIYADESLFEAGIAPGRLARRVGDAEVVRLAAAIRGVLGRAVEARGTTLRDYVDANGEPGGFRVSHKVYGRSGLACVTCGRRLKSGSLAQRTTVWCPHCQR
jgi:formamidopyrimidine-DNA glycosylase